GELEGGDVVFGARDEVDSQEPLGEGSARLMKDRAGPGRGLPAARRAVEDPTCRRVAVLNPPAVRAHKPVRPTQLDERRMTLLLRAVAPIELNEAQPLLELDRISKGLWQ